MLTAIPAAQAREFVRERHYTRTCAAGVERYGWTVNGVLVGVTVFDTGVHAMRQGVFGPDYYRHVLHHHRLVIDSSQPKGTASQFIGASLRQLPKDRPATWAVVTYADECQGHLGTIYQATNAIYTGVCAKGNLKFRTPEGEIVPTQSLRGTWPERRAQAAAAGWEEIRCLGKHRYVYILGTARQRKHRPCLQWECLPYPTRRR